MLFDLPKVSLRSLKEFAREMLMIVISILTALALEQAVQSVHHANVVRETSQRLDAEIRANIDELHRAQIGNAEQLKALEHLSTILNEDIKAQMPDAAIVDHFAKESKQDFTLRVTAMNPNHDEWDAAMASQAISWMRQADLRRYSVAYSTLRSVPDLITGNMTTLLNGSQMVDVMGDLESRSVSPRDLRHSLNQMIAVLAIADEVMGRAERTLARTFQNDANTQK
jgi:hypothetical protein